MPQLNDKERLELAQQAEKAMEKAKNKKQLREVFTDENHGYLVIGFRVLGRLMVGKTAEEATARRGKKEDDR